MFLAGKNAKAKGGMGNSSEWFYLPKSQINSRNYAVWLFQMALLRQVTIMIVPRDMKELVPNRGVEHKKNSHRRLFMCKDFKE